MLSQEEVDLLIDSNDALENYFRNTIIPQLFVDANLILRKFTPPAMKQFNFKPEDIGRPFVEMKENIRYSSIIENIRQVIESNEILEKEIQTTDFRWYQMNILPYTIQKTGRSNGVIITFVDITARIHDLKHQEKLIADHEILLDAISHDIKNPLSSLTLAVDLLKSISFSNVEELKSVLSTVERSIQKMHDIITELADTRRQEHKYEPFEELVNFEHILEDVRLTLAEDIKESHAKIKSEIKVSEMKYSRRKLRSIVYNLLSNAIKYRSPDREPEIFVKTEWDNEFVLITVKDNGIGIEQSKFDDVFTKYYRIDNSTEGSGIGLFLINEIVSNMGGRILLKSKPGSGSEFLVYLKDVTGTTK